MPEETNRKAIYSGNPDAKACLLGPSKESIELIKRVQDTNDRILALNETIIRTLLAPPIFFSGVRPPISRESDES